LIRKIFSADMRLFFKGTPPHQRDTFDQSFGQITTAEVFVVPAGGFISCAHGGILVQPQAGGPGMKCFKLSLRGSDISHLKGADIDLPPLIG
jgi:hypothetical protein